ncbi:MAG: DUF2804 domain-containing protein [Chitinophagales bacterium]|nr:DUF2804 domain-containing protein [Chitinophagales bacterium]
MVATTPTYQRAFHTQVNSATSNGRFNFGIYNQPLKEVNLLDAKAPLGFSLPRPLQYMRLKEWQAFQLGNEDYFLMVAIYNAKTMALAQFIIHDIKRGKKIKYEQKVPFTKIKVAQSLYGTFSEFRSKAFYLRANNKLEEGKIEIEVETKRFQGMPDIRGRFTGYHTQAAVQPQVVVMPFAENRGMYSHKCLMHMEGNLHIDRQSISFERDESHMLMDDHKGYYPYVMQYDWVTGAGFDTIHRLIGFNLTDNQVTNQEVYNENCLWVDDKISLLPPVKVTRPQGVEKDWFIKDQYGRVDLVFSPVINTRVDVNLLVIKSDYHGPYGFFKGYIINDSDSKINVDGIFGMGEQFYLRA